MDRYTFTRERNFSVSQNLFIHPATLTRSTHHLDNGDDRHHDHDHDRLTLGVDRDVKDINTNEVIFHSRPPISSSSKSPPHHHHHYRVLCDSEGDPIYRLVDPPLLSSTKSLLQLRRPHLNVEDLDSDGRIVYVVRKRPSFITTSMKTSSFPRRNSNIELDVWHASTGYDDDNPATVPDRNPPFVSVCGDLVGGNYEFIVNGQRVGKVAGDLFNMGNVLGATGRYGVQVSPGCDVALFILLAAYVDELYAERGVRRTMTTMRRRTMMMRTTTTTSSSKNKRRRERMKKGHVDVDDVASLQQHQQDEQQGDDNDVGDGFTDVNQKRIILDEQQREQHQHNTGNGDNTIRKNNDVSTSKHVRGDDNDEGENVGDDVQVVKHMQASSTTTTTTTTTTTKFDDDFDSLADQFEKNLTNM